jgi:hypothetical protein
MNFRTLVMIAVAALVIVVAVKMNRNPVIEQTEQTSDVEVLDNNTTELNDDEVIIEDTDNQADAMPADDNAVVIEDNVVIEDQQEVSEPDNLPTTLNEPVDLEEETLETTVDGEPLTEEEAEEMEPAVVDESPVKALETGPAETVSEEPVTTE